MIIKLYKIHVWQADIDIRECGEFVGLGPYTGPSDHGDDDGGRNYILPDGYFVGTDKDGIKHIFSEKYPNLPCYLDWYCDTPRLDGEILLKSANI